MIQELLHQAEKEKEILGKLYDLAWESCDLDLLKVMWLSHERYSKIISEIKGLRPELVSEFHRRVGDEVKRLERRIDLGLEIPYDGLREDIKRFGKLLLQLEAVARG